MQCCGRRLVLSLLMELCNTGAKLGYVSRNDGFGMESSLLTPLLGRMGSQD